tara:strand:+ start:183 stop:692 length:510 start_codon:yes stop_codon:yes gene_type:complete
MGALMGEAGAKRANQAALRNEKRSLDAWGLNKIAREEQRKIANSQTNSALMAQQTKAMYAQAHAMGTQEAIAGSSGRKIDETSRSSLMSVFDFEGRVKGEDIRNRRINIDMGHAVQDLQSDQNLRSNLDAAQDMKQSESAAFWSGLFSDVATGVGMISGGTNIFKGWKK